MIELEEFEKIVKKIDKKKYHINRTLSFTEEGIPYISDWNIYRKDMTTEDYFNIKNLAVLSFAKNNTLEDIQKLIEEE